MMIGRYIRQTLLKPYELFASRNIDISEIKTTGIILGPYRNLTTLTVGLMALHPNIQVLNHAGQRILPCKLLNIFNNPNPKIYENFLRYSVYISQSGRRGDYGGSVVLSHAFKHDKINTYYKNRFGEKRLKDDISTLFWKESLRISNYLKNNQTNIDKLLTNIPGLRFLLPIRNPKDCAKSNLKTGHSRIFNNIEGEPNIYNVLTSILLEFKWFNDLMKKYPENFLFFTEKNMDKDKISEIAEFLNIEKDKRWINESADVFDIKKTYDHTDEVNKHYISELERIFNNDDKMKIELKRFI